LILGYNRLTYEATPEIRPPPPTPQKMASIFEKSYWRKISTPIVPCPAITNGSSYGGIFVKPHSYLFFNKKSKKKKKILILKRG